jgi:glycosyltransferase involved in cell wall biosynthesis
MKASIIVPTYNGATKIPNLLQALQNQTEKDFEVIIVSDGSKDNSQQVVLDKDWYLDIHFIHQENQGRSATRNNGAAMAKGDTLIFFDDDMRPKTNCVAEHIAHHQKYEGSIVTGGLQEEVTSFSNELFRYKAYLSNKWLSPLASSSSTPLEKSSIFVTTANFSVSRSVFHQLGGFDIRLTDAEDYDFAVRAFLKNIPLYFNSGAFAWHDDVITTRSYINRQRQYAAAQKKLFTIHPDWKNQGFLKEPYRPTGLKASIFKLFCSMEWINAIDKGSLKWLPQGLRYRIYDYIITANGVFFPQMIEI